MFLWWQASSLSQVVRYGVAWEEDGIQLAEAVRFVIELSLTEGEIIVTQDVRLSTYGLDEVCISVITTYELIALALAWTHIFAVVSLVVLDILYGPEPPTLELCVVVFRVLVERLQDANPFASIGLVAGVHGDVIAYAEARAQIVHGGVDHQLVTGGPLALADERRLGRDDLGGAKLGDGSFAVAHGDGG
ncbi:hypothetical protein FGB62_58g133 [Gracilaria domingensis]|nr:hypothetical protein FGB62_58g133 [Gracilaria domingensis]